jgi:hypothetical protein
LRFGEAKIRSAKLSSFSSEAAKKNEAIDFAIARTCNIGPESDRETYNSGFHAVTFSAGQDHENLLALLLVTAVAALAQPHPNYEIYTIRYATIPDFPVLELVAGADPARELNSP